MPDPQEPNGKPALRTAIAEWSQLGILAILIIYGPAWWNAFNQSHDKWSAIGTQMRQEQDARHAAERKAESERSERAWGRVEKLTTAIEKSSDSTRELVSEIKRERTTRGGG